MSDKFLTWCGNVLLASLLVLLVSQQAVFAQTSADAIGDPQPGKIFVPLSGTATVKRIEGLSVSPVSFDTGLIEIGDSTVKTVTLTHTGAINSLPIEINSATLFGKSANEYSTSFNGFVTLYPGDTIDIDVLFTPMLPGTKSAGMQLDIGGATAPYVMLFNGWSRYPLTSDLGTSDTTLNFGTAIEGGKIKKNFLLTNLGDTQAPAIYVSAIELGGDFPGAFSVDFTPVQLAPGQTVDIQVEMSAPTEGFKSATVAVIHDGINPTVEMVFEGEVVKPAAIEIGFGKSTLNNAAVTRGTALEFGPDGKLYVTQMNGTILVYTVTRNGKNNYTASQTETINLVKNVQNHEDNGTTNTVLNTRLVTGIALAGTAGAPIIYVASSDPRQAAGPSGNDANLDTNSGILHKLTKNGGNWTKQDMVRGLPRSEENHVPNGLLLQGNKILMLTGGHTNMGAPSNNFAMLPEYALSGALLEIDLGAIGGGTYDLPTLDDEDRAGANDANDPFGGNDGKNQAKLVQGGPVQIYATGFRNAYDVVLTEAGNLYTWDNGPNAGWGAAPVGNCTNDTANAGQTHWDNLHLVTKGSYAGHPNPTRGNKANTFNNSNPQTPIEGPALPADCNYKAPGQDGSLTTLQSSTNGLAEYRATNFGAAMKGNLLAASFDKAIWRVQFNATGTQVTSKSKLFTGVGTTPLDVTAQPDDQVFPGTIWVVDNLANFITVFEPNDF